ncbi:hypothetical protein EON64_20545, partial [archaeon]
MSTSLVPLCPLPAYLPITAPNSPPVPPIPISTRIAMRTLLLLLPAGLLLCAGSLLTVVSIVEGEGALLACLVKMHSIIMSSAHGKDIGFATLVLEDEARNLTVLTVRARMLPCFEGRAGPLVFAAWAPPNALAHLTQRGFDRSLVYARFYLPHLFPHLQRCVYMDNDVIVNMDIL